MLLFGIGLVFGATGSFQIQEIGFAVVSGLYTPSLMLIGIFMIIAALLFKVGPFLSISGIPMYTKEVQNL
ncbi:MAG: hypothetical protein EBQ66_03900 [Flavobacteriia bacterium]|nr:hypothetical protein [Flavobacteriia bacterium]